MRRAPEARPGPGGVVVRPVRPEDVASLWGLLRELAVYERLEDSLTGSPERLADHLFGRAWPAVDGLVADERGAIVGYALFYGVFSTFWTRPTIWLEDLFVTETRRGLGIGRALLAGVARVAVERGCPRVDWAVLDWNTSSIAFYEGLGAGRHGGWHNYRLVGDRLAELAAEARA